MAALNDGISDVELRRKLVEFGEVVGPVTDATRSLLFRKLKRLEKECKGRRIAEERSSPRRASPGRKSSGQSQTPSRRLIGFSSDEEDAPQSSAKSYKAPRGRLSEGSAAYSEPAARKRKSTRNSNNRQSLPNSVGRFADNTVSDSGRSRDEEATDSDGQIYSKSSDRTRYSKFAYRPFLRPRYGVDERETKTVFSPLSRDEDVSDESEPTIARRENQAGAKKAKDPKRLAKIVLLISAVCVILLCVALKWYSSKDLNSEHLEKLPLCGNGLANRELKPPDCATLRDISKKYAGLLFHKLSTKAGLFDCGDPNVDSRNVSLEELREQIRKDNASRPEEDQEKILNTTLDLMTDETIWKIRLLSKQNEEVFLFDEAAWVETLLSTKPITCRIREATSRLVYLILVVALIIGGLLFGYFIVRQRWRREEEETRKMYQFVEKIIDILREHHEASKTDKNVLPYLAIPHVRDMLIPPSERQNLSKVWSRAVRFLSANESRIRVESQRIAGEDFEVWRWIHIAPPKHHSHKMSLSGTKHGKFWQGQAFENFQSAVNPPVISPTPCLKIRNMFDPDVETEEGWHVMIQDAILEKCIENGASVVHIAVDKSSSEGCVYVKCDCHHSAGLAFRSLHGCWFDGRLVAVKYLTLKRYHQRFPVALEATENLSPSGSSPSSLVTFDPDEGEDDDDVNDSDVEVV